MRKLIDALAAHYIEQQDRPGAGHRGARIHLWAGAGLPAERGLCAGAQAAQAARSGGARDLRPGVRLRHAGDSPGRDRAGPARGAGRRSAGHRRHHGGHGEAGEAVGRRDCRAGLCRRTRLPEGPRPLQGVRRLQPAALRRVGRAG